MIGSHYSDVVIESQSQLAPNFDKTPLTMTEVSDSLQHFQSQDEWIWINISSRSASQAVQSDQAYGAGYIIQKGQSTSKIGRGALNLAIVQTAETVLFNRKAIGVSERTDLQEEKTISLSPLIDEITYLRLVTLLIRVTSAVREVMY